MDTLEKNGRRNNLEIIGTALLSVATLTVAWCTYQSTLWEGEQDFSLAESNLHYRRAQENVLLASQQREIDAAVSISFLEAVVDNDKKRIEYFFRRGDTRISPILHAWLLTDPLNNKNAPPHPLAMEEYKVLMKSLLATSDTAKEKAERLWHKAQYDNAVSDKYTLFTVMFSLSIFLGAIAPKFTRIKVATGFMIFAGVLFIINFLLLLLFMPVAEIF